MGRELLGRSISRQKAGCYESGAFWQRIYLRKRDVVPFTPDTRAPEGAT